MSDRAAPAFCSPSRCPVGQPGTLVGTPRGTPTACLFLNIVGSILAQQLCVEGDAQRRLARAAIYPRRIRARRTLLYCHKNLLEPTVEGIVVLWTTYSEDGEPRKERTEHVYSCCRAACDDALEAQFRKRGLISGWKGLSDLIIPMSFIRWIVVCFNEFYSGMTYSADALKNMKGLLINIFPLVCRDMIETEKEI